jgi:hypothetical protein
MWYFRMETCILLHEASSIYWELIISQNYHIVLLHFFLFSKAGCLLCVVLLARTDSFHEHDAYGSAKLHCHTRRFRMSGATHPPHPTPYTSMVYTVTTLLFVCTVAHMYRSVTHQLYVHTKWYSTLRLSGSMQIPYKYYQVYFVQACRKPFRYMQQ